MKLLRKWSWSVMTLVEVFHNGKVYNVDVGMAGVVVVDFDALKVYKRAGGIERPMWGAESTAQRHSNPNVICMSCASGDCQSCSARRCECAQPYHVALVENPPAAETLVGILERHGETVEDITVLSVRAPYA